MAQQVFPTKGNLIATKKTLALSTMGYDLMDKKRNILKIGRASCRERV